MRSLDAIAGVGVVLDGADYEVDVVVAHVHPLHVALKILIGAESLGAEAEVLGKLFVASQFGGFIKQRGSLLNLLGKIVVIPNALQCTVFVADNHSVLAGLVRVVESVPFFLGHVGGIELRSSGFRANAIHKRLVTIQAVPRAVGDGGEAVHDVGGFEEQRQHLFFVVAQVVDVGRQSILGILVRQMRFLLDRLGGLFRLLVVVAGGGSNGQCCYED